MAIQQWTVKIDFNKFDPSKTQDWALIKNLKEYNESELIIKSDDGKTGDILLTMQNKKLAQSICNLFSGATMRPSIIVESEKIHMLNYSQYLITDMMAN